MNRRLVATGRRVRHAFDGVRVRVTLSAMLAVGCALGVSAAIVEVTFAHERQHILLTTAQEQGRVVTAMNPELTPPIQLPPSQSLESGLVQVLHSGKVLAASRELRREPPLWIPGDPQVQTNDYVLAGQARDVHVVEVPVSFGTTHDNVVVVTSLDQYDNSLLYVQRLLEIGLPILLLVVGAICWVIVGWALRPIELLRREVAEVAAVSGAHRVAEPPTDDEVGRLARTLNSMLDRLEASTLRERRFVSDASHELRSPIANIRTEIEVALHHPDRAEWPRVASEVLAQDERMGRLVESLLMLARSADGHLASVDPTAGPTDLAAVANQVVAEAAARSNGLAVVAHTHPTPVQAPAVYLERIAANLVDNACRYASSRVEVRVSTFRGVATLRVSDDGPGVPVKDRGRIFERFVRLDEARDRVHGGFGLGLAIVADLCRAFGGTIEISDSEGGGAVFTMFMPLAPEAVNGPSAADGPAAADGPSGANAGTGAAGSTARDPDRPSMAGSSWN
ncbi:MAG TPA: HAMP domain-containing sensor histidine kinase [Acidimicrobiales bacterium]|nr:HAMP domain-containing sensor histidine kinase [Acidimicrobiales bacterium]